MEYKTVEEAKNLPGLRLALTVGIPGPWSMAARALLDHRKVPYAPVRQEAAGANEELVAWTGHRNAPIAVYNSEPPVTGWLEIIYLAERLGSGPSLLPMRSYDRATVLGLCAEIAGVEGFGWNRRIFTIRFLELRKIQQAKEMVTTDTSKQVLRTYGIQDQELTVADPKVTNILVGFDERLESQEKAGSQYLVGSEVTAADYYWACFFTMVHPLPQEVNPMPTWLRPGYAEVSPAIAERLTPRLLRHQQFIYEKHIGLPLDY